MTKMNPEIRDEWTTALRTKMIGDEPIEQGQSHLRIHSDTGPDKRCCLGVLSDIAVLHGIIDAPLLDNGYKYVYEEEETAGLSSVVREWSGVKTGLGDFEDRIEGHSCLATMNDYGVSFADIADVIERYF